MKKILMFVLAVIVSVPYVMRTSAADSFQVSVLSGRPDMITGGDALVSVRAPQGEALDKVNIEVNDKNITSVLHRDSAAHTLTGLVSGLKTGDNSLKVFSSPAS